MDNLPEEESKADSNALAKLSKNSALSGRLEVGKQGNEGFANVASLAWGVMLYNHGPPNFGGMSILASRSFKSLLGQQQTLCINADCLQGYNSICFSTCFSDMTNSEPYLQELEGHHGGYIMISFFHLLQ